MAPVLFVVAKDRGCGLGVLEVDRAGLAALIALEVVGKALLLVERAHPGGLNGRHVDESVIAAGFIGDEAITLGVVEKLHCADRHINFLVWTEAEVAAIALGEAERRKLEP